MLPAGQRPRGRRPPHQPALGRPRAWPRYPASRRRRGAGPGSAPAEEAAAALGQGGGRAYLGGAPQRARAGGSSSGCGGCCCPCPGPGGGGPWKGGRLLRGRSPPALPRLLFTAARRAGLPVSAPPRPGPPPPPWPGAARAGEAGAPQRDAAVPAPAGLPLEPPRGRARTSGVAAPLRGSRRERAPGTCARGPGGGGTGGDREATIGSGASALRPPRAQPSARPPAAAGGGAAVTIAQVEAARALVRRITKPGCHLSFKKCMYAESLKTAYSRCFVTCSS